MLKIVRRAGVVALSGLVAAVLVLMPVSHAQAEPLPATYSGSTHGDVLSLALTSTVADVTGVIAHSATNVDSTADPRAHAESANLEAGAVGIGVAVASDEANADNATPADTYTTGFGSVDVPGVLTVGAVNGSGSAAWASDAACVPDGTPIATSTTSITDANVGLTLAGVGLELLDVGAVQTTGDVTLNAGSVVATSSGNVSDFTLVNGLVELDVVSNPTLTATSDGTTGTVSANAYSVDVTIGGVTTSLAAGASIPITLNVGVLSVSLTLSVGALQDNSAGATGSGSMTFLNLTGSVTAPVVGTVATIDLGILPLTATATGAAGGVECTVLDPPVITSPGNGDTTSETPTISGTGVPGATVTVTEGATVIGTAPVALDGTWSLVPATPLAVGSHTIVATQASATATSGPSNAVTFEVADVTPPAAPVITDPVDGAVINDATPTVTGTGEPGDTVEVLVDGAPVGTTTVAGDGSWSFDVPTPLADGVHTFTATQTDGAGNVSPPSAPVTVTVDATAPAAPVITDPVDGAVINDATPTVTGTGESGDTVEVSIDGAVVGTTTVAGDGSWSFDVPTPLVDGDHTFTATQTDGAGNVSPPSAPVTVTVDATAPAAPVITDPVDGSTINDPTPTVSGTGEAGDTVEVSIDGAVVGTTTVAGDGSWSFDVPTPLADGDHTFTATQTDPAGNVSPPSAPVTVTVDATAPAAPVITDPVDGAVINDATPTVTGTGESGDTVEVSIDGAVVGTTTVAGDGSWSFDVPTPLADGDHTFTATQTDPAGNVSPPSTPVTFTVDTVAPAAPVITDPVDGAVINDATPTVTGTGEPGDTVEVLVDGAPVGTTTVDGDGNWSVDVPALPDGDHTITATQTDGAGNVSPPSPPVTFTVDTVAPAAPVITDPVDGSTINDPTPTVSGTGEAGDTVEVEVDGAPAGTSTVGDDGNWSVDVPALPDGDHTITATQTDGAGNVSPPSTPVTFTLDATPPAAPVIDSPTNGSTTTDLTPIVTGSADPGSTVRVIVGDTVVATTVAGADGSWSVEFATTLTCGDPTIVATATDAAGNTSPASNPVSFTAICLTGDALPTTGTSGLPKLVTAGVLLIFAGGMLLLATRRRAARVARANRGTA